jgi:hypothetical protein
MPHQLDQGILVNSFKPTRESWTAISSSSSRFFKGFLNVQVKWTNHKQQQQKNAILHKIMTSV